MIYVTGDIHGSIDISKLSNKNGKEVKLTTITELYAALCEEYIYYE